MGEYSEFSFKNSVRGIAFLETVPSSSSCAQRIILRTKMSWPILKQRKIIFFQEILGRTYSDLNEKI